jgi:hypothetical protein
MGYLYRHIRLDKNEPFYIGIGGFDSKEKDGSYTRAYTKYSRNKHWKNIFNSTDYEVQIIFDDLTLEEAFEKEKEFIYLYGRKDLGTGTLVNMTNGGEGGCGRKHTQESKDKMSKSQTGKKHNLGRKHSIETKKKIGLSSKGRNVNRIPYNKSNIITELEVLKMRTDGFSLRKISKFLHIGKSTVLRILKRNIK